MKKFIDEFTNQFENRELQPDEYLNESDHLIYCTKCHTPRQGRYTLQGRVFMPPIRCKCQQEIYDQEEAKRKLSEKQAEIERMKASGLQDKSLYDYTFEKDTGINPEMHLAHKYVENWDDMKARSSGLLLWGDVGTGKSFFAGCIANALLEKGVPVLMTNFSRILNTLSGMHFEDRNQFIDSRYRSKKPLIVTTNLTLEELNNPTDRAHSRIYDRILERCAPIRINNRNIRKDNASANLQEAKKILL